MADDHDPPAAKHSPSPHWSYDDADGPKQWAELTPDFEACRRGKQQSPINLNGVRDGELPEIVFNYHPGIASILNNGHTIQENFDATSSINVDGTTYYLHQFHFHTPSEHQINGLSYPLEMHLVHKSVEGDLAVVGVLFEKGYSHPTLDLVCEYMPGEAGETSTVESLSIDPASLVPQEHEYLTYTGSLTTPPCSEGVRWMVMTTPQTVSQDQVERLHAMMGDNNRPIQNRNGRSVTRGH